MCFLSKAVLVAVFPAASFAATITYTSSASFFAALGASPFTTETYESLLLNSVITNGSTVDGLTYTGLPRNGGRIDNLYNSFGNQSLAISGNPDFFLASEGFSVTFPFQVRAVGIFFNGGPSPANVLQINTAAGSAGNGTVYDASTLYFVGLISTTSFSSATFLGTGGASSGYNVDNLTYAGAAEARVPEPATLGMFALGAIGLLVLKMRHSARQPG